MEEGGEGSSVAPWRKYLCEQAEARAARVARGIDCRLRFGCRYRESPVDLSTYVPRSEYPPTADIEVELHWDTRRGRVASLVPKWAQEEYAARTNTPANGRKQDYPNSGSQATDAAATGKRSQATIVAASGKHKQATIAAIHAIKALKLPPVAHPSATDPCARKRDHPNSASLVTAAEKERHWDSLRAAARARNPHRWEAPILILDKGRSTVLLPNRPRPPK